MRVEQYNTIFERVAGEIAIRQTIVIRRQRAAGQVTPEVRPARRVVPLYRGVVLSTHGMRSRGEWQKWINAPLTDAGFLHDPVDLGHIGWLKAPRRKTAIGAAEKIAERYRQLRGKADVVHMIAHSFGTIATARALERNPTMRLQHVILWGCVLRKSYDWPHLLDRGQVSAVLNEACRRDTAVRLAPVAFFRHRGGDAGAFGFVTSDGRVCNQFHEWIEHSVLGTEMSCQDAWVPFLQTGRVG